LRALQLRLDEHAGKCYKAHPIRKAFVHPEPEVRVCALRSKCLRPYKRNGAEVTGTGLYCSENCRANRHSPKKTIQSCCPEPRSGCSGSGGRI